MVEAIEPPKGNNLSIWEDDPSERKKNLPNLEVELRMVPLKSTARVEKWTFQGYFTV